MPTAKPTSRLWPGSEVVIDTATQDSPQQQSLRQVVNRKATLDDRARVLDNKARERQGPHQFRGRHKDITEAQPRHFMTRSALIPDVYNRGARSNCINALACSHRRPITRTARSFCAERRFISSTISRSIPKEYLIAVWNLIAGVISSQSQRCYLEDGPEPPGKRIEDAARLVARSADEWGHTVEEDDPGSLRAPRTPEEKIKLVRQASRIRETALQVANCANDWGERLKRNRSSS
ncbi:hypothetical protein CGRA01v4_12441 [Colletotrichum graminicola]|nr:hypothetical protein CGRA01v4_12441 [Colletotrichum graminicola]